jgi:hypothetical protein
VAEAARRRRCGEVGARRIEARLARRDEAQRAHREGHAQRVVDRRDLSRLLREQRQAEGHTASAVAHVRGPALDLETVGLPVEEAAREEADLVTLLEELLRELLGLVVRARVEDADAAIARHELGRARLEAGRRDVDRAGDAVAVERRLFAHVHRHHAALLEELGELVGLELVGRPRQHGREELEDRLLVGEPLVPRTDDLAALHDEEHRDALHLEGLRQATVLVAVDLDDLDLPLELLGDLLDDGRLDFAGLGTSLRRSR